MQKVKNTKQDWKPSATLGSLKARAEMYAQIRAFFFERQVLEVETPLIGTSTATDPLLQSMNLDVSHRGKSQLHYLQTSPEFPMKRLLASFGEPIYQICKTFRQGEFGPKHNPEFSMLEWYRPGFTLKELLKETVDLIEAICGPYRVEVLSYREAFIKFLSLNPFTASIDQLREVALRQARYTGDELSRTEYLDLLLGVCIEPKLGVDEGNLMSIMTEYPAEQASLAKVKTDCFGNQVAERFEVYIQGLEIANAYFELTDVQEQRRRFEADNADRSASGLAEVRIDDNLLAALDSGMPECAGIALGLDRLLMIKLKEKNIRGVLAFPIDKA